MHIYSSPRILSVNLGSVSTSMSNTCFLAVYILSRSRIMCTAFFHLFLSTFFPLFTFTVLFSIYYFGILPVSAGTMLEENNKTCGPSLQIQLRSCSVLPLHSQTTPPLNEVHMWVYTCVCERVLERVCACVMVPGHRLSQAGVFKNTQRDQLQGRTSNPSGVVTGLFLFLRWRTCSVYKKRASNCANKKTKIL